MNGSRNCNLPCSLQTESYLEELTDTVPEADMQTQTDPFLDRPATPMFVPAKMGVDATTQIEAGDLFDFDFEVRSHCNVGANLEQLLVSRNTVHGCQAAWSKSGTCLTLSWLRQGHGE